MSGIFRAGLVLVLLLSMVIGAGCAGEGDAEPPFSVSSTVVAHETTQEISVFAPEPEGSWPVAYLLHCYDCNREDSAEMARQLASQGIVAFVPDYRSTDAPVTQEQDLECGYRYARSIAAEYGGDLDQPVTFVGDSHGASWALGIGVGETYYGPGGDFGGACFTGVPRPDVVVAIGGCYYEYDGQTELVLPVIDLMLEKTATATQDGDLVLVVGEDDDMCHAWQSEDATAALQAVGYKAEVHVMSGGDHHNVVFWTQSDGEWVTIPDDPVGKQVLQLILDNIKAATP